MTNRTLRIGNISAMGKRPTAYSVTVGALFLAVVVASIIEPPTAYLVPLVVAAWAVAYWTLKRETTPRYKRHE